MKTSIIFLFLLIFPYKHFAQPDTTHIPLNNNSSLTTQQSLLVLSKTLNKKRLTAVLISESVIYTATMLGLNQAWYKNYPRSSFHFFNDNNQWLQMDKIGHAVTGYSVGRMGIDILRWSGVKNKKAIWYGGNLGNIFLTTVEVFDGFSSQWGASYGDLLANFLGTGLLIGQELAWKEQRLLLKFSVHHTNYATYRPDVLGNNFSERLLKDYNGQTYWLSANIASFMKEETKFPKWLNVAVGYGADGMMGGDKNPLFDDEEKPLPLFDRVRQYYLSLDVDLTKVHTNSKLLKLLFGTFGFIKIPAPALELSKWKIKFNRFYF